MVDHDQRLKQLLQEFFPEFMLLFFPVIAQRLDLTNIEWLEQETFVNPPQGERRRLDLVAKVQRQDAPPEETEPWLAVLHVEIEGNDAIVVMQQRMYEYYEILRRRYPHPILPMVMYLHVQLQGIGVDAFVTKFEDMEVLRFQYCYVALPGLDGEQYAAGDNWLGVGLSSLMKMAPERRGQVLKEAIRRIAVSEESAKRRFLLCECLQAYTPLEPEQWREVLESILKEPNVEVRTMAKTMRDYLLEEGAQEGQRRMLRKLLEKRFGPLSATAQARLDQCSISRLEELGEAFAVNASLQELGLED